MALSPYKNYRTLRRYRQIIMTVGRFGFGEIVGRLNLFAVLKLKRGEDGARAEARASRAEKETG